MRKHLGGAFRSPIIRVLRALGLNRILGKTYYRFIHGFAPAGAELPGAVARCLEQAQRENLAENTDYCEFGVFKGFTFLHAQTTARQLRIDSMRFFGFDSFEGLPEPTADDIPAGKQQPFYKGQYRWTLERVRERLDGHVDWSKTFLVDGYFNDTLGQDWIASGIRRISVALVDCDLYSSTVDVLNFLDSRLVDGAFVIMDDWKSYGAGDEDGQPRALREFLQRLPHWHCRHEFDYGHYGRVFRFTRELCK